MTATTTNTLAAETGGATVTVLRRNGQLETHQVPDAQSAAEFVAAVATRPDTRAIEVECWPAPLGAETGPDELDGCGIFAPWPYLTAGLLWVVLVAGVVALAT